MKNFNSVTLVTRTLSKKENGSPENKYKQQEVRCQKIDNFSKYYYGETRTMQKSINLKIQKHYAYRNLDHIIFQKVKYRVEEILNDRKSSLFVILDCEEMLDASN